MFLSYVSLHTIFTKPSKKSKTVLTCPTVFKYSLSAVTPFGNPQRWMGQNTFPILLLNDDNMKEEH